MITFEPFFVFCVFFFCGLSDGECGVFAFSLRGIVWSGPLIKALITRHVGLRIR